ncbi:MAG: M1 family aminopeptidase, partial [Longimicrobiales bacterium]
VVGVHAFYRPEATAWPEAARYLRHALSFHATHWQPYLYPKIAAAEGPIGGMEYPMLVFIGAPEDPQALYAVLAHELAHQWWSMAVGSNETRYAWQDEGLTTYVEDLAVRDFFPRADDPALATMDSYLRIAGTDQEQPIMTRPDLFGIGPQYGVAAYTKPGTLFRALATVLGEDRLEAALRVYARRWQNKHPSPWDLFSTIEDVAGRDLDWFWTPWFFETATLDQAIIAVDVAPDSTGDRVIITVEDQGEAPMPVPITVTLENGETRTTTLPVEPWLEGRIRQQATITVPGAVQKVEIDAERRFPDVDRQDNAWVRR